MAPPLEQSSTNVWVEPQPDWVLERYPEWPERRVVEILPTGLAPWPGRVVVLVAMLALAWWFGLREAADVLDQSRTSGFDPAKPYQPLPWFWMTLTACLFIVAAAVAVERLCTGPARATGVATVGLMATVVTFLGLPVLVQTRGAVDQNVPDEVPGWLSSLEPAQWSVAYLWPLALAASFALSGVLLFAVSFAKQRNYLTECLPPSEMPDFGAEVLRQTAVWGSPGQTINAIEGGAFAAGVVGENGTARLLDAYLRKVPNAKVVHSLELANGGDIDHVAILPGTRPTPVLIDSKAYKRGDYRFDPNTGSTGHHFLDKAIDSAQRHVNGQLPIERAIIVIHTEGMTSTSQVGDVTVVPASGLVDLLVSWTLEPATFDAAATAHIFRQLRPDELPPPPDAPEPSPWTVRLSSSEARRVIEGEEVDLAQAPAARVPEARNPMALAVRRLVAVIGVLVFSVAFLLGVRMLESIIGSFTGSTFELPLPGWGWWLLGLAVGIGWLWARNTQSQRRIADFGLVEAADVATVFGWLVGGWLVFSVFKGAAIIRWFFGLF